MLTITNIDKLQNEMVAYNGSNWMVTKININNELDYYGIVIRKQPDTAGEYIVFYLMRDSVGDGEYELHSNKSSTKRRIHTTDIKTLYKFLSLIQKEIRRLC